MINLAKWTRNSRIYDQLANRLSRIFYCFWLSFFFCSHPAAVLFCIISKAIIFLQSNNSSFNSFFLIMYRHQIGEWMFWCSQFKMQISNKWSFDYLKIKQAIMINRNCIWRFESKSEIKYMNLYISRFLYYRVIYSIHHNERPFVIELILIYLICIIGTDLLWLNRHISSKIFSQNLWTTSKKTQRKLPSKFEWHQNNSPMRIYFVHFRRLYFFLIFIVIFHQMRFEKKQAGYHE